MAEPGQVSLFDEPDSVTAIKPEDPPAATAGVTIPLWTNEDSCSANVITEIQQSSIPSAGPTAQEIDSSTLGVEEQAESETPQPEDAPEDPDLQDSDVGDQAESKTPQPSAASEGPIPTMTLDELMAETENEALFRETRIEISLTLMPGDDNQAGRKIVGSVGAEGAEFVFISMRGTEEAGLKQLEASITKFKREASQRLKKPAAKTTSRSSSKVAQTSAKKQAGQPKK